MSSFRRIVLCVVLVIGAICGIPIRPADIEASLKHDQNAVQVIEAESPALPLLD